MRNLKAQRLYDLHQELKWWLETHGSDRRVWGREGIGKTLKNHLRKVGHWRNLSRGKTKKIGR